MPANQPKESSTSVKVTFLDASKIIKQLRKISATVLEKDQSVKGIYLFGSLAEDTHVKGSDADILILLKHDDRRFVDRIPDYMRDFLAAPIPTDLFPYTVNEIDRMMINENFFITTLWRRKVPWRSETIR